MDRLQRRALTVGVIGAVVCAGETILDPRAFFYSYLLAFLFWLGVTLGSLGLLMVQHLSGGAWGFVVRRQLEAASRLVPLMALLFLPLIFGLRTLYPWTRPEIVAADEILQAKQVYLNIPFFLIRAGLYFAVWSAIAWLLSRWSLEQDAHGEEPVGHRMRALSAGGLVLYVLTMTFAAVDWLMSLEPHWFSTIFGIIVIAGHGLSAIAAAIVVLAVLAREKPISDVAAPTRFHDLGNLLLMFLMVWGYVSFSQFLVIWSGNLPEEIPWYVHRLGESWQRLGVVLIVFHFVVPFLLLLMRRTKEVRANLVKVAAALLVMRLVELFWIIAPERSPDRFSLYWMDLAAPAAIGGFWVVLFIRELKSRPLLPRYGDEGAYDLAPESWNAEAGGGGAA